MKQSATLSMIRHGMIHIKMLSGMVEPTGDPTTLKKEERAMRPTPEVVRKWSSIQQAATGCTGIYQLMPQVEIFVHSMDI